MIMHNVHENAEHGLDLYSSYDYPNYVFYKEGIKHNAIQYEHESHTDLYRLLFHPSIVDKLLPHTRDYYPKHIHYLTSNGVHSQAYYITIEGVVSSAMEASFDSTIAVHDDGAVWRITTDKITHMSLEIPPYLHQVSTKLGVNSALVADGYLRGNVRVDCINQCLTHNDACRSLCLWNSGIVSCYQGSVKILVPNVDSHEHAQIIRVAKNLSSPKTIGYIHHIHVQYPIIAEDQANLSAINTEIDAEQFKYLVIEYMNASNGKIAQVFFSQTSRYDFCEEQSILFEVIPNDTVVRKYLLDLSQLSTWKGIIHAVRFDPFSYDANEGYFELSKISFVKEQPSGDFCQFISSEEAETIYQRAGYRR